ncbi:MAG: hypothetical protein K2K96_10235 [Lachnospiraceae bacterium]|nr:hypothetical protein [Lachnospiraceae bacterium]
MTKKAGKKKRVIITLTAALVALSVLSAVLYHNYTEEICVMEVVDHMGQREGVSMDDILVEIGYSIIKNGEEIENYLYIFENGDVYSGYCINYYYMYHSYNQELAERDEYYYYMDDRYWDYLYGQYYWGRLSSRDLDSIIKELAQVDDFDCYHRVMETVGDFGFGGSEEYGDFMYDTQLGTQGEQIYDQENSDIYRGHWYYARLEWNGTEGLWRISRGTVEEMVMYRYNEHAHNAIDIVKSTWAYGQWTNQIFGEGWEERIDLKDEMEVMERKRSAIQQLALYWKFVWDSILSLFS